jgi:phage tail sheath protein FI
MAEKIVSPGVFTKENDLSFLQQGVADIGAAFIGPFKEGPLVPTIVNSQAEFETLFGSVDDTYYTPLAVQSYLREAGTATICRVGGIGGYTERAPLLLTSTTTSSVSASVGILFNTDTNTISFTDSMASTTSSMAFDGLFNLASGSKFAQISASLNPTAVNDIEAVFGTNPKNNSGSVEGVKQVYTYAFFTSRSAALDHANSHVTASKLDDQDFTFDAQEAKTPIIQSQTISNVKYDLFRFITLGAGDSSNTKVKIGILNVKTAGSVNGTDYGTFTIVVRSFNDTNKKKNVLETYSNVNLDPNSPNYIARVIGDRSKSIASDGKVTEYGDWINNSKYIRLWNGSDIGYVNTSEIPVQAIPVAHKAYQLPVYVSNVSLRNSIPSASFAIADTTTYGGIDLDFNPDNSIYLKAIPENATYASMTGSNAAYSLENDGVSISSTSATEIAKRNFIVAFQEGFDGMSPTIQIASGNSISAGNSQGFNLSTTASSGSVAYGKHISALSNADEYDINMVVTPGVIRRLHTSVVTSVLDMVEQRSDCFYIVDTTSEIDTITQVTTQTDAVDSNYAATYYPWIKTIDTNTNKLISVPPSVLLPGVFASNDRVAAEWFAPAGLNRGGLTGAVGVLNRLTQSERDTLYEGKVNPICQFPGQGIVVWGQKTLQDKPSALDRINVRRLLLTVRKYIASTSKYLVFEQNSSETRNRFLNIVNPYLEGIQQRQGLYAFRVVMDETNNTPDVIDRNILKGAIYLQPTKTAEFIQIDFNILPTGASFGG